MYYTLAENLPMFCSFPETLKDAEIKVSGLINLAEEISRQLNIQAVAWVLLGVLARFIMRIGAESRAESIEKI